MGQGAGVPTPTIRPGLTPSPTRSLKLAGPDAGLYIADETSTAVYKVDYRSGKVLWKYQFRLKHPSSFGPYALTNYLLVQQGYVFIESQNEVVYALNAATGHLAWSYVFGNNVDLVRGQVNPPVLDHGILFIPGLEYLPDKTNPRNLSKFPQDRLYLFDAQTGKLLKTYQIVRGFTINDGVLYTSDDEGGPIQAINLKNGQVLWQKIIPGEFFMAPFLLKNRVYLRANNQYFPVSNHKILNRYKSSLYAFDATTGQQFWHSPGTISSGPVFDFPISEETIVSGVIGEGISAYDAATGHLRWSRKMPFTGDLHAEGNTLYMTFDPAGANETWGYPPSDPFVPGIMSLNAATGSLIWQKMIITQLAGDLHSDSILGFLVHKSILYIQRSTQVKDHQTYTNWTTAMDPGGKVLWQINLGGFADGVLVP
ncbi:hypothetical protein KSF_001770 [Reticulibacter mediterranei]|uniref:Pyrrolo-quinoline quinone repeat domain-containing protein n=1 Tax=Reticulibacter mediterranei TaxID=2778369 RepID=A0A8J3MWR5_9CHLR|nr:hypothetical protein KSF_001770 [Reticulibacter mediterranei]